MAFLERIRSDATAALKAGDQARADALRFSLAQIQNREIEKRGTGNKDPLTDDEVMDVLRKEVKKKRESIELFRKGGREDLATKEERELGYLQGYLPAEPTAEEIETIVRELRASGLNDFKSIIREAMKRLKGRADGKAVGAAIQKVLAE